MPREKSLLTDLELRGRGTRTYDPQSPLLVSRRGETPPRLLAAREVQKGDFVGIEYGGCWPSTPVRMPVAADRPYRGSEKRIRVPQTLGSELAFLLGAYLSEGHTTRSNWSVILTNSVLEVLERAQRAWWDLFHLKARMTQQPGRCTGLVVSSKRLVEYLDVLGCGSRAANKRVPQVIYQARRSDVLSFLEGASLDAYTTHKYAGKWGICLESSAAINGLQDLLTLLGIVNAQIPKNNKHMGKIYYELYAPGPWGQELSRIVPFMEPDKAARARGYQSRLYKTGSTDVIPGIAGPELYALVPRGRCGRNGRGTGRQALTHLCDPRTQRVSRASVERARMAGAVLPAWLQKVVESGTRFVPVVNVVSRQLGSPLLRQQDAGANGR